MRILALLTEDPVSPSEESNDKDDSSEEASHWSIAGTYHTVLSLVIAIAPRHHPIMMITMVPEMRGYLTCQCGY